MNTLLPHGKFPVDFYVTCATVIPVLFLALAVEGTFYEDLWKLVSELREQRRLAKSPKEKARAEQAAFVGRVYASYLAAGILVAAGAGEFLALWALYQVLESWRWQRLAVLLCTLVLTGLVVGVPVIGTTRQRNPEAVRQRNPEAVNGRGSSAASDGGEPGAS